LTCQLAAARRRAARRLRFCSAASLPWFPGPCSPTVFRSAICDCLPLNGTFSLSRPPLREAPPRRAGRAGRARAWNSTSRGKNVLHATREGSTPSAAASLRRLCSGERRAWGAWQLRAAGAARCRARPRDVGGCRGVEAHQPEAGGREARESGQPDRQCVRVLPQGRRRERRRWRRRQAGVGCC